MIGLLGLGSFSTLYYLSKLNEYYNEKQGGYSTCPLIVYNVDFHEINSLLPNNFDELKPLVLDAISKLGTYDIHKIVVPNITLHETIDKLALNNHIKNMLVHPIDLMQLKLKQIMPKSVYILGTKYTMNASYITELIKDSGVSVTLLDKGQQEIIDKIRQSVYSNGVTADDVTSLVKIIKSRPASIPIIACTELSIVMNEIAQNTHRLDLVEEQLLAGIASFNFESD